MKSSKLFLLMGVVLTFMALQSCATIFGSKTNTLVFEDLENMEAQVFIDDSLVGNTSGNLVLPKQVIQHGSMLEIRSEGYKTEEYMLLRKPHAGYVIADFVVGCVPLIIDMANGNALRPKPRKFEVNLEKAE